MTENLMAAHLCIKTVMHRRVVHTERTTTILCAVSNTTVPQRTGRPGIEIGQGTVYHGKLARIGATVEPGSESG